MMLRRTFLTSSVAAIAVPRAALGQARLPRVAFLSPNSPGVEAVEVFTRALEALGWVAGRTVILDVRYSNGDDAQLPGLAEELLALEPDVFVTNSSRGTAVAGAATKTVPVVARFDEPQALDDLVGPNLGRPQGNVTGVLGTPILMAGVLVEIAAELVPSSGSIGYLSDLGLPTRDSTEEAAARAAALGLTFVRADATVAADLPPAFSLWARSRVAAAVVPNATLFSNERALVLRLAAASSFPVVYCAPATAAAGGLMSYGTDSAPDFRLMAAYVDRILRGACPRDLPVEVASPVMTRMRYSRKSDSDPSYRAGVC